MQLLVLLVLFLVFKELMLDFTVHVFLNRRLNRYFIKWVKDFVFASLMSFGFVDAVVIRNFDKKRN